MFLYCYKNIDLNVFFQIKIEPLLFQSSFGPSIDGVTITHDWKEKMSKIGNNTKILIIFFFINKQRLNLNIVNKFTDLQKKY